MHAPFMVALVASLLVAADEQKPASQGELGQLTSLEKQLLDAWKNKDSGPLQKLLREDYVEIRGADSRRRTKAEILKVVGQTRITDYTMEDIRLVPLHREAAILTYLLTLKGALDEKDHFPNAAYVSAAWVRQDATWLCAYRQWTPVTKEGGGPQRITDFEVGMTTNSVRYLYKGNAMLEDVQATLTITLDQGSIPTQAYWGTWQPGEVKEISLQFLAMGISAVQRLDLSAPATMGGKRFLCTFTTRREARIPADWKKNPPNLQLP